jgi:hypothetical protein
MKRKLLAGLTAVLLGALGLAGEQAWSWAANEYRLHRDNAVAVPVLVEQVNQLRSQVDDLRAFTNRETWRWIHQEQTNQIVRQQLGRKKDR